MTEYSGKRKTIRRVRTDDEKKARFISELVAGYTIRQACKRASVSSSDAYRWRTEDESFARHWADAIEQTFDNLESIVLNTAALAPRGVPGAASCAMFLLKARNPQRYCDRARAIVLQAETEKQREKDALEAADAETWSRVLKALDTIAAHKRALAGPDA